MFGRRISEARGEKLRAWRSLEVLEGRLVLAPDLLATAAPFETLGPTLLPASHARLALPAVLSDPHSRAAINAVPIMWQASPAFSYAGEWLVQIDATGPTTRDHLSGAIATNQVKLRKPAGAIQVVEDLGGEGMFRLQTSADFPYEELLQSLESIAGFRHAEPNFVVWSTETWPNDPRFGDLWGLHNTGQSGGTPGADIGALAAWDITTGSSDIVIGVIDTGTDFFHPDLIENLWINPGEIPGDGIDNDGNGYIDDVYGWDFINDDNDPFDDRGHGTHVAGTIAGRGNNGLGVTGVSWTSKIMTLKFLGADGRGSSSDAVKAVNYATMMKRDYGVNVVATNNSWGGGGFSTLLVNAIQASAAENMLFVAAAGNDNVNTDVIPHYPSSYNLANIISVAATTRTDQKSGFSNYGAVSVDLGAPGSSILSTTPGNSYSYYNGTSMATPHVAGVVALIYSVFPNVSYHEVRDAIFASVDPLPALAGITRMGGRLNAHGALLAMGLRVLSSTPAVGEVVYALPVDFTIRLTNAYNPASVAAGDLLVNGIAAHGVTLLDAETLVFHFNSSPVSTQGVQQMTIAEGAITRLSDGGGIQAFQGAFRYDALPMTVVATTPSGSETVQLPLSSIQVEVNEPIDPASISINDLQLSQGFVTGFSILNNQTVVYHVAGIVYDGVLDVSLPAGALQDEFGNPSLPFSLPIVLDVVQVAAKPFERLEPLGGLMFGSRQNEGLLHAADDSDDWTFVVEGGQTVTAVVVPQSTAATMNIELLGYTALVTAHGSGQPVGVGPIYIPHDSQLVVRVTGSASTHYRLELYRNAAIEMLDSSPAVPQLLAGSWTDLGGARYGLLGSSHTTADVDAYAVDLTDAVGERVDIVLKGQPGVDYSGSVLQLIGPDGTTVVATASASPLGPTAREYDLAILDHLVTMPGVYRLQVQADVTGEYGIGLTQALAFDTEPNDLLDDPLRNLDVTRRALGMVDRLPVEGMLQLQVDPDQSYLTITARFEGFPFPFDEQLPGSMTAQLEGVLWAELSSGMLQFLTGTTIDPISNPGPFSPGNAPADFAAQFNWGSSLITAAIRDSLFGVVSFPMALNAQGEFNPQLIGFETLEGVAAIDFPNLFSDVLSIRGFFADNIATEMGSVVVDGSELNIDVPIEVYLLLSYSDGITITVEMEIEARIVAAVRVPTPEDWYTLSLDEGEAVRLSTATLFDGVGSLNTLDPRISIRDANGVELAFDDNSAADGKNSVLTFVAPASGTYYIVVEAVSGQGEYVLSIDNPPPVAGMSGPNVGKAGTLLPFLLTANDPSPTEQSQGFTYQIDWNGDGLIDQTVNGGAELSLQHNFAQAGTYEVRVTASDVAGMQSAAVSHTIHVFSLTISGGDIIWQGSGGDDWVEFVQLDEMTVEVRTLRLGGHPADGLFVDVYESAESVRAFGHSGRDRLDASQLSTIGVYFEGGLGNDTLIGGDANDIIKGEFDGAAGDGAEGNDWIEGRGGNDTLYGDGADGGEGGADTILGGSGNNLLWGDGGDGAEGRADSLIGGTGNDTIIGHTGSDFIDGVAGNNLLIGGRDGSEGNDTIVGGTGHDILVGGKGNDRLVATAGRNILLGGGGSDTLIAGGGGDILVADATDYDLDPAGLIAIRDEWTSGGSYATRIDNIRTGNGLTGGHTLAVGDTVVDDEAVDHLFGNNQVELNWYIYNLAFDQITGNHGSEEEDDTDGT